MSKINEKDEFLFLDKTRVESVLDEIKSENDEFTDTIQVQVNLKGLDPKRDNKITKDVTMPHKVRYMDKIIVIADKETAERCEKNNIPFYTIDDLMQDKMIKERKNIFKINKHFILSKGYNKVYQLKNFLRAGKIPYQLKPDDKVEDVYKNATYMYKLRVKDMSVTSFPIGHTKMDNNALYENLKHVFGVVVAALKKGEDNIKNVFLKGAQKTPKKIY